MAVVAAVTAVAVGAHERADDDDEQHGNDGEHQEQPGRPAPEIGLDLRIAVVDHASSPRYWCGRITSMTLQALCPVAEVRSARGERSLLPVRWKHRPWVVRWRRDACRAVCLRAGAFFAGCLRA